MVLNQIFELSMALDANRFQDILTKAYSKSEQLQEIEEGYIDLSMAAKGVTVIFRDSQYKKKIRLLINTGLVADDISDTDKLARKLTKRIDEYFSHKYRVDDFTLSGMNLFVDIDVGNRKTVSDYLKVMQRVGKVKAFSPVSFDFLDDVDNFCLSGNSNSINFLLYDLRSAIMGRRSNADASRKTLKLVGRQAGSILRAEVRLTRPKAIRVYTDAADVSAQIVELVEDSTDVFMDTFVRAVPFGDFYKKDKATEIIRSEVKDTIMRRRMLRLLTLIPEKKSLHLAQKAMNCRDVEKIMDAFVKINLSPVTISKRHEVKHLDNIYSFFL